MNVPLEHPTHRFRPLTRSESCKQSSPIDTVLYCTVLYSYFETNSNKIHVNTTTNTVYVFIHFDNNTSRSYSPYQPPKPFLQSIDITCYFRHTKQAKIDRNRLKNWSTFRIHSFCRHKSSSLQVVKSSSLVPTVQSSRPRPPSELRV